MSTDQDNKTTDEATDAETPKKTKQIGVARSKTFLFKAKRKWLFFKESPSPEEIDATTNPWFEEMAKRGMPANMGHYSCTSRNGDVYQMYLYTERITIEV